MAHKVMTPEIVQEIFRLRTVEKKTLKQIALKLCLSYELVRTQLEKLKPAPLAPPPSKHISKKSKQTVQIKQPEPYNQNVKYDFLQFLRPVMRWAVKETGLPRHHVEGLLYLYPRGTFSKSEFVSFYRIISMYQHSKLLELIQKGFIVEWRPRKGRGQPALYVLSNKAKNIIALMHEYMTGDKQLPTGKSILLSDGTRQSKYYIDVFKKINSERKQAKK